MESPSTPFGDRKAGKRGQDFFLPISYQNKRRAEDDAEKKEKVAEEKAKCNFFFERLISENTEKCGQILRQSHGRMLHADALRNRKLGGRRRQEREILSAKKKKYIQIYWRVGRSISNHKNGLSLDEVPLAKTTLLLPRSRGWQPSKKSIIITKPFLAVVLYRTLQQMMPGNNII